MTRKNKNIIMILLLVALIILSVFTIYFISDKSNGSMHTNQISANNSMGQGSKPPSLNKEDNSKESNSNKDNSNQSSGNENHKRPFMKDDNPNNKNDSGNGHTRDKNIYKKEFRNNSTTVTFNNTNMKIIYYVFFGAESILISLIITYLIMSNFNKKGFKETFEGDKKVIYILLTIIIASILLNVESIITKSILNNNTNSNIIEKINIKSNNEL